MVALVNITVEDDHSTTRAKSYGAVPLERSGH